MREKLAQSRWRKYIDKNVDHSPEGLSDFASETTRNRYQRRGRPGHWQDVLNMKNLPEEKRVKYIKQVLSSKKGFGHTTDGRKLSNFTKEMKKNTMRSLDPNNPSSSMIVPGSTFADPDDYIDIFHGGNRAKTTAFAKNGNGYSSLNSGAVLHDGNVATKGLHFYPTLSAETPGFAEATTMGYGGHPAILKGKIKRKYLYPDTHSGREYAESHGLPSEYFNKMKDVEVYNPNTGEVYYKRDGQSSSLPYGRTKTPGSPSAAEKARLSNAGRKDFTLVDPSTNHTKSKEEIKNAFKEKLKNKRLDRALAVQDKAAPFGSSTSYGNSKEEIKNALKEKLKNKRLKKLGLAGLGVGAAGGLSTYVYNKHKNKRGLIKNEK